MEMWDGVILGDQADLLASLLIPFEGALKSNRGRNIIFAQWLPSSFAL